MNGWINQPHWYSINAKKFNAGFLRRNDLGTPIQPLSRLSVMTLVCSNKEFLELNLGKLEIQMGARVVFFGLLFQAPLWYHQLFFPQTSIEPLILSGLCICQCFWGQHQIFLMMVDLKSDMVKKIKPQQTPVINHSFLKSQQKEPLLAFNKTNVFVSHLKLFKKFLCLLSLDYSF